MWSFLSRDPAETRALGRALAAVAAPGAVVALTGELGAGKTALVQGLGLGLGVEGPVVSPTFILVSEHEGRLPLLHADLYRLRPEDLQNLGLEEALERWPGVAAVEWADRFPALLPDDHLDIHIEHAPEGRHLTARARGPRHEALLTAWRAEVARG